MAGLQFRFYPTKKGMGGGGRRSVRLAEGEHTQFGVVLTREPY